jgi:RNA polymerase sigma-70 factor (ECF subfamily)
MVPAEVTERDVAAFLAALEPGPRAAYAALPELAAALARLVAAADQPALDVTRFVADVAARLDPAVTPERALPALAAVRAADLALAMACARGEPTAVARLDHEVGGAIAAAHAAHRGAAITLDELRQAIRARLLVAEPGGAPRIATYQGRGALTAWVRMVAARHLIDAARAEDARPDRPRGDDVLLDRATASEDPELAFLKREYRAGFRAAFAEVLAGLDARDRNILRHRYLDGLEVGELATIYGVHRGSMSRILGRIRDELLAGLRRQLLARLGEETEALDGVMAMVGSQLDLSLSRLLR